MPAPLPFEATPTQLSFGGCMTMMETMVMMLLLVAMIRTVIARFVVESTQVNKNELYRNTGWQSARNVERTRDTAHHKCKPSSESNE